MSKACFTRPNSSLSCIRTCRVKLQHVSCGLPSGTLPSVSPVHIMNTAVLFFAWSVTEFRFPVQRTTCTTVSLMRFTTASFDERDTYECEAILCLWAVYGGPQSRVPTRIIICSTSRRYVWSVIALVVSARQCWLVIHAVPGDVSTRCWLAQGTPPIPQPFAGVYEALVHMWTAIICALIGRITEG